MIFFASIVSRNSGRAKAKNGYCGETARMDTWKWSNWILFGRGRAQFADQELHGDVLSWRNGQKFQSGKSLFKLLFWPWKRIGIFTRDVWGRRRRIRRHQRRRYHSRWCKRAFQIQDHEENVQKYSSLGRIWTRLAVFLQRRKYF